MPQQAEAEAKELMVMSESFPKREERSAVGANS